MTTVLQSIIDGVLEDVKSREVPVSQLVRQLPDAPTLRGAAQILRGPTMKLIAEVKRASPSRGDLAPISDPTQLARAYENAGASVISVLTEARRFKGSIADFIAVRSAVDLPLLRKDFIVTEFQVLESRLMGTDLLLLIVAGLSKSAFSDYFQMAVELGMDVLVEIHDQDELEVGLGVGAKIIGVNSRNLKTLEINRNVFSDLLPLIPLEVIKVAESGISHRSHVEEIEKLGANAILVGEALVKANDANEAIAALLAR